jgi:hypothetical protein
MSTATTFSTPTSAFAGFFSACTTSYHSLGCIKLYKVKTPCMANLCYDEVTNAPITVNVCIAADLEFKADIARLPSTTSQQLEWSHQAHNGLTGHPGVHPLTATIYGLKQNGH